MSVRNSKLPEELEADGPVVVVEPAVPPRQLLRKTIVTALAVAVTADGLQLILGPAGFVVADTVIDIVAAIVTIGLLGFHPLLLPTFVTELIPVVDLLPTWTGCVVALIALRRRDIP